MAIPAINIELDVQTVVVVTGDQLASDVADEVVILSLKEGMYFGLNPVGSAIWKLIQEPRSIQDIRDALMEQYNVSVEDCEREIFEFCRTLLAEGLIELRDA